MLDSYANLKVEVAEWLNRDDLTAKIPTFVTLIEARIRRKVRRKSLRATISINSGTVTLPSDCADLRSLHLLSGFVHRDRPFVIGTHEQLADARVRSAGIAGRPHVGAVMGNQLFVIPVPDQTYQAEIVYYEKLVPLSDAAPSNSTLVEAPDLYLYGALLEAAPYLEHDERIPTWKARVDEIMAELDTAREREEYSASLTPVRLPVSFN